MTDALPAPFTGATISGPRAVMLRDVNDIERFATLVHKSSLVPSEYRHKLGDVIGVIMFGLELGLNPMQALQNISWINGKPSVYGDMMLALVEASGLLEAFHELEPDEALRARKGRCALKRRGRPEIVRTFSVDMAETAKLWGKGVWLQYPGRMLQMRARSWALRDAFSDVLKGLYAREEAEDITLSTSTPPTDAPRDDPERRRAWLLSDITAVFKAAVEGLESEAKKDRVRELLSRSFGIATWKLLDELTLEALQGGYQTLLELTAPDAAGAPPSDGPETPVAEGPGEIVQRQGGEGPSEASGETAQAPQGRQPTGQVRVAGGGEIVQPEGGQMVLGDSVEAVTEEFATSPPSDPVEARWGPLHGQWKQYSLPEADYQRLKAAGQYSAAVDRLDVAREEAEAKATAKRKRP